MKHPVDVFVGKRVRQQRWLIGMTQQQLADAVGIKFQQIQKYETGMNRISASRLWDISRTMNVPIAYFFDGIEGKGAGPHDDRDTLGSKQAMDLVRAFHAIPDAQRKRLLDLARVLSEAASEAA